MNVIIAIAAMAVGTEQARAQFIAFTQWDGGGADDRWENAQNWDLDVVPNSAYDVTLGSGITPNLVINAEGTAILAGSPPRLVFVDPELAADFLTISTANSFTVDGFRFGDPFLGGGGMTSLTLTSGDLTRVDVAGDEGNHVLNMFVRLAQDGGWNVGGSGELSVTSISETGGPRTFAKTGAGTLAANLFVTGAKNINQGVFRGGLGGPGAVTVAAGAAWHITDLSISSPSPITLRGLPGSIFFSTLVTVGTFPTTLSGPMTIEDNPNISVETGGKLTLSGGLTSVNNSGFGFFGAGELVLSGLGAGMINANVLGGQLTIAHGGALGAGSVTVADSSGGVAIPSVALADGIAFGNPIMLNRATIRALGNSTVSSPITFPGIFPSNSTLDVPQAGHTLTLNGSITDNDRGFSLTKAGPGVVILSGNTAISGGLTVAEGVLANNGVIAGSATHVTGDARLVGSGQFADVSVTDNGQLSPGASAVAGAFSPAIVAMDDLAFIGSTTELLIQLGGLAPGSGYDQLHVAGNATLAGQLSVSLGNGFSLGASQSFRVLDVAGALSGQFAGLGEGGLVGNFGGEDLFITYAGGDGNDVALFTAGAGFSADFDEDGDVDGDDLAQWEGDFGVNDLSDADNDGDSDGADFLAWQQQLGSVPAAPAAGAVPEPRTLLLQSVGGILLVVTAWRRATSRAAGVF